MAIQEAQKSLPSTPSSQIRLGYSTTLVRACPNKKSDLDSIFMMLSKKAVKALSGRNGRSHRYTQ